nr:histidine phosphatase family protein [Candidatus Krumholzibacteria bacterium]
MTRQLYFLRHGLADRSAFLGGDDRLRPLTAEGCRRLELQAQHLSRMNWQPDLILTSPLTRAEQTARIIAHGLEWAVPCQVEKVLECGFGMVDLEDLLVRHPVASKLVLVGHEPDFSTLISRLTGGADMAVKKGSLVRVD